MTSLFASLFTPQPKSTKLTTPVQPKRLSSSELGRVSGGGPNGTWKVQSQSQLCGPNGTW